MRDEDRQRLDEREHAWRLEAFGVLETKTSLISFGVRGQQYVALKIAKEPGNEWRGGDILEAFGEASSVKVYERTDGAALLEWLRPGIALADLAVEGYDERATEVLVEVIAAMAASGTLPAHVPTAATWAAAFDTYLASGDQRIPAPLVREAQRVYLDLCASQREPRLLHGDLHHGNVLFDYQRGWVAIDPKGVIAEAEFELAAAVRNPIDWPEIFNDPVTIDRRIEQFARGLRLDGRRIIGWAFSQAVLAAIWLTEDAELHLVDAWLQLAGTLRARL